MTLFPRALPVLLFAGTLLVAPMAFADAASEDDAAALQLKEQGNAEMDALHYDKALEKFEQGLARVKDPTIRATLTYNKGRTLQAMGNYPLALEEFEKFDKTAPAELKAKVVTFNQLLEDTRSRVGQISVHCTVIGAEIRLAERVVGTCGGEVTTVRANAGKVRLEVRKDGYIPFAKNLDLKGRETQIVDAVLASSATQGVLRIESVPGALARVDGKNLGVVPVDAAVDPGNHVIELSKAGFETTTKSILMVSGEKRLVKVDQLDTPPVTKNAWFWVTVGGAVAVVGATIGVIIYAANTEKEPGGGSIPPYRVSTGGIRF